MLSGMQILRLSGWLFHLRSFLIRILDVLRRMREKQLVRKHSTIRRRERMRQSTQFRAGRVIECMPNTPYARSPLQLIWAFIFQRHQLKPPHKLQYVNPDLALLRQRSEALRVTWLGHSSLFLEMKGLRMLVDPVFEFASPLIAKPLFDRNVCAPVSKEALPLPDLIVISHDHYDHLEKSTIRYFSDKPIRFLVPLGVGRHLERWGVPAERIVELDWWESIEVGGVILTATPANHNSGRIGLDKNRTLWCSWAFQSTCGSVFYSGDSAYDGHFSEIRKRLGTFDLAFMEVAANVKNGQGFPVENWGHMQANHTIKAFQDLGATRLFPVHWSTFELFSHQWDEPMRDLIVDAWHADCQLITPMIGETTYPLTESNTAYWWWEDAHISELVSAQLAGQPLLETSPAASGY